MRLGNVGILVAFDAGAQWVELRKFYHRYSRCKLHPVQFEELGAHLFYNARRFNRHPGLITGQGGGRATFLTAPVAGLSPEPVFDAFNKDDYAEVLNAFTGAPLELIRPDEARLLSWLRGSQGRFNRMPIKKFPYIVK